MALRTAHYTNIIAIGTVLCLISLVVVLFSVNPYTASTSGIALFYTSVFLSVTGAITLAGLLVRSRLTSGLFLTNVAVSFRQGFLLGLLVVISLGLQAERLLYWWVEASLLLFFIFIEAFFNLS